MENPKLALALQVSERFFRDILRAYGLNAEYKLLKGMGPDGIRLDDDTHYWFMPKVGEHELCWYIDIGERGEARTVLELGPPDIKRRVFWEEDRGWQYSLMGVENETIVDKLHELQLAELNRQLDVEFKVGHEHPISEDVARDIINGFALDYLELRGLIQGHEPN